MSIIPFTAPLKLIRTSKLLKLYISTVYADRFVAIIPNLPFFFCAWRAWHHYRGISFFSRGSSEIKLTFGPAYKASSYLGDLIKYDLIDSRASNDLDRMYGNLSPFSITEGGLAGSAQPRLLSAEAIPHIISLFDLPSSAERDIFRALEQTKLRLSKDSS